MRNFNNKPIAVLLLFIGLFRLQPLNSQCALTYYAGIGVANAGTAFSTWTGFGPGQYFAFPVLNGASYDISTCGAPVSTQLTGYDASASSVIFLNTGNGPQCSGSNASVSFMPNFTNYCYVQVTQYYCGAGGSSSIDLYLRQNDNIVFTSSSAAMCSGQTRVLGATPANVGSTPGGYGDPGTFSGTGVSGGVFTAPTVTATTNFTVTYTFGYVSHQQVIPVSPASSVAISVSGGTICTGKSFTLNPSGANSYTFSGGSAVVSPTATTSYTVTGTSTAACTSSGTAVATVSVNALPVVSVNSGSICNGQSFTLSPSGASTYTYSSGSAVVSPTASASYSVTGTSAAGCVSSNTAVSSVTVSAQPVISVNSGSICNGQSFTLSPSGASTYTYSSGSAVVSPTANGSYSVTGTSTAGCVSSNTAVSSVIVNALPVISVNSGSICNGQSFTLSPSGASTYTYSSGSAVVSPTANASYSVTGTSAAGCVSSNTAVSSVTVNSLPVVSVNSGSICNGQSFTLSPSGVSTYTYSSGSAVVSPTANASYSVTGTSAAGCVSSNTAVSSVTVNAQPVISVNSGSICAGKSFTIAPTGANTYTYSGGSAVVSPTANTSYSVTGTSTAGCISSNTAVSSVTVITLPLVSVNTGSMCNGQSFTLSPSGASTYTFSSGSAVVSPTTNTSYSVTGTSTAGCVSSNTAVSTITVNALPVVSVNSGSICNGQSFTLSPSGASTYTYSSGSAVVSPTTNTSYSVTGTSSAGCVSAGPAIGTVTVNAVPVLTVATTNTTVCVGRTATLTASGANTYTWLPSGTTSTIAVSPTVTTIYTVVGTSSAGCNSGSVTLSTSVAPLPTISVSSGSICPGGTYTITPSGALTYTYTNGTTTLTGSTATIAAASATSYTVSGTDVNGCVSTGTGNGVSSISIFAAPQITITASSASVCSGVTTSLSASGASTYTWTSPASTGSLVAVSPTATTVYSVTGTGTNVCNGIKSFTVAVNPVPTISINSGTICSGYNFTLNASGAGSGGTYTLSNATGTINAVVSPTANANYSVIGTTSLGCISNTLTPAVSTVVVNASPVIAAANGTVCSGSVYSIQPSGANTYSVNGVSTTTIGAVTPTGTTTYTVTGTGTNNCVSPVPAVVSVTVVALPTLTATTSVPAICIGQNTAVLSASGANTYTWSTSAATSTVAVSPTVTTTYSVTGTATTGCINGQTVAVAVNPLPTITAATTSSFICKNVTTTIIASGANTYTWSNGSTLTAVPVTPSATTVYSVAGTNTNGCVAGTTLAVVVNTNVISTSASSGSICAGDASTLTASGAISYTWNGTFSFPNFVVTPSTTTVYSVSATDAVGCPQNTTISITVNQLPNVTATPSSSSICTGESATLVASGANSYTWDSGSNATSIVVSPTISLVYGYTLSGTDANGCVGTSTLSLSVNACLGTKTLSGDEPVIKVYPNPNNGEFSISSSNSMKLTIVNELGQVVKHISMDGNGTSHVSLNELPNGIYFVVGAGNNQAVKQKVVIAR